MLVDVYNHVYVNKVFMIVCVDKFSECYGGHDGGFFLASWRYQRIAICLIRLGVYRA